MRTLKWFLVMFVVREIKGGCDKGYFRSTHGKCTHCPEGTYCDNIYCNGSCSACQPGYYAPITGSSSCLVCKPGSYSARPGQFTCKLCPSGSYNSDQMSSSPNSCILCPKGTYNSNSGQSQCDSCPIGTNTTTTGATFFSMCESNSSKAQSSSLSITTSVPSILFTTSVPSLSMTSSPSPTIIPSIHHISSNKNNSPIVILLASAMVLCIGACIALYYYRMYIDKKLNNVTDMPRSTFSRIPLDEVEVELGDKN
eukprot:gene5972-12049_t